ncbi:M15 family metallopeptidase [Nakamurella leprariae]|uniref:M15 family metallopeptidase n=1 Tax=Nakamurella leprariae TaxID=2803911 RepID=A0A939C1L1_9ACTN|nr:M15 family metallopeptidase [Nakamurella leprariae]MBM9467262.1 M15 family metallopeptidase [Nakamurella leprariae]
MASGVSQNGWALDPATRSYPVPGAGVSLTLVADDDAATILLYCAAAFHVSVAPLKAAQCGGYDKRPIGGLGGTTSNHRSGTAEDLDYSDFPQGVRRMTAQQRAACNAIERNCEGAIRWGGNYGGSSLVDEQHFEINTTDRALLRRVAQKVASGGVGAGVGSALAPAGVPLSIPALAGITPLGGASTSAGAAAVEKPLPQVGPVTPVALIPLTGAPLVEADNRLSEIRVDGAGLTSNITRRVTRASLSYSSQEVTQLALTIQDTPDAAIVASGLFDQGANIDFGDQHMEVRKLDITGGAHGPVLELAARSRVICDLKGPRHSGEGTWGEMDISQWVTDRAREAGAAALVQPGLGAQAITRQAKQSTWDVMADLAQIVGAWCYETEQTICFGRPSWLANLPGRLGWDLWWEAWDRYSPGLAGMPEYTWSPDSDEEILTVRLLSGDADKARPGQVVTLTGRLGRANGAWVMRDVRPPLTRIGPVVVVCGRPVDPEPRGGTGSVS